MITPQSTTKEWINQIRAQHPKINLRLLEKMINALCLVEALKINGLYFIFKGGTSLVLLLDSPQRLSIDIDILTQASREEIEIILTKLCAQTIFAKFELDEHRSYKEGVPKAHYKLFYAPNFASPEDNSILLDVLFAENPYPKLQKTPMQMAWLETKEPIIFLDLPTIESIAGDKLTAFAPNTTGIRYGEGKEMEIIKQMFDVGQLFDKIIDFEVFRQSYFQNVQQELAYRPVLVGKSYKDVLEDTWLTCLQIVKRENRELIQGISSFNSYTIYHFGDENAIETAGKIALLVAKLMKQDDTALPTLDTTSYKATDYLILNPGFNFLNRKVRMANYAMFYWQKAIEVYTS